MQQLESVGLHGLLRSQSTGLDPKLLAILRCPVCRDNLAEVDTHLLCTGCERSFPVVYGIPDLRVYDDPLIPRADDYRKSEKIYAKAKELSFGELVRYYWSLPTYPYTPPDLIDRFVRHVLTDELRIKTYEDKLGLGERFLELGCGTGALIAAANKRFGFVVGCDVAFRWLLIARKRLEEAGLPSYLVCCCADHLPFPNGCFDSLASVSLLEHVDDAGAVLSECKRTGRPRARMFIWTTNRFSLLSEPHVRVWGVGFLPRRWMAAYVRWRKGMAYEKKKLLSCVELNRLLRKTGWEGLEFLLPSVTASDFSHLGRMERIAARIYRLAVKIPCIARPLVAVLPVLQVIAESKISSQGMEVVG